MIVTVQGYLSSFIKVVLSGSSSSSKYAMHIMHLVTGEIHSKYQEAALRSLDGTAIGIEHPRYHFVL